MSDFHYNMEAKPNKNLAMALGKFSDLLIKEKIINPETDNTALIEAMGNVAHHLSQLPTEKAKETVKANEKEQVKKPTLSSIDFIKGPLASIISKHEKSQNKLEEQRKQKYLEEISHLKNKPTISTLSKKLV